MLSARGSWPRFRATAPFTFVRCSVAHRNHPERNEDAVLVDRHNGLAAVFDGVGGKADGHIAAQAASRAIHDGWKRVVASMGTRSAVVASHKLNVAETLQGLVEEAHRQIRLEGEQLAKAAGEALESFKYPATTFALAVFCLDADADGYTMTFAHVGDSRIYLLRGQQALQRLTQDDGFLAVLLSKGEIAQSDALRIDQATNVEQLSAVERGYFGKRYGITQALGWDGIETIHIDQLKLEPGDRVLLCTDGIHDNLTDQEIEEVLRGGAPKTAANRLVQRAQQRSLQDRSVTIRAKGDDMSAVVMTSRDFQHLL